MTLKGRFSRPVWFYLILPVTLLLLVVILFTPVIMRTESILKIQPNQQGLSLPDGFYLYQHLDGRGIQIKSITPDNNSLVVSLESPEQQTQAIEVLQDILPAGYAIVLSESKKRHRLLPVFNGNKKT